ncbi:hypothetical protein [Micromonospora sp. WMMD980]|uniref:hypothetical protein n=1 Tax=Micromonospora sp. WMMD980 TaxID=3016088 RepID=UPI00241692D5|nr:hypothetical protein [Micromonospora sp. WMMD980]MDG4803807.1 hypothetical protein [Micromonospora sp. WMMD980]
MSDSGATERAREPTDERRPAAGTAETEPDVLLDVPELSVDEIRLAVDGLDADLSLRARLANLLQLDAGVRCTWRASSWTSPASGRRHC